VEHGTLRLHVGIQVRVDACTDVFDLDEFDG